MKAAECHPDRKYVAKGLCRQCYDAKWKRDKRKADPEWKAKVYEATKQWHKNNPNYERLRSRKRYKENPEYSKALITNWWSRHPEKRKEYRERRKARDPERFRAKVREYVKKRKARKKGAKVCDFTSEQWLRVLQEHGHSCFYCKNKFDSLTQDHMIPLSRGGAHTKANIVPACGTCNNRKGTKTAEEYLR